MAVEFIGIAPSMNILIYHCVEGTLKAINQSARQ